MFSRSAFEQFGRLPGGPRHPVENALKKGIDGRALKFLWRRGGGLDGFGGGYRLQLDTEEACHHNADG
jgi:hypothetical protein